jgi:hypothetical protein
MVRDVVADFAPGSPWKDILLVFSGMPNVSV